MSASNGRRTSMADVAVRASVSHQTVSRVLNGHPHVRPATRQRVLAAIDELGYSPNGAARALASRRSRTIGVVAASTNLHGPVSTLTSLEQAARAAGYYLSLITFPVVDPAAVHEALAHFDSQLVEAIVVIAPTPDVGAVVEQLRGKTPVVLISSDENPPPGIVHINIDQRAGAHAVVDLLSRSGHERIAFISGPRANYDADIRLDGWREALVERGLPVPPIYLGSWEASDGHAAGTQLAASILDAPRQAPTAVFVANDHMAIGVIHACAQAGLRVPDDLSVVGFDDIPGADFLLPALTTVRQPFDRLGAVAVEGLVSALRGEAPPATCVQPILVTRKSHGRPRLESLSTLPTERTRTGRLR